MAPWTLTWLKITATVATGHRSSSISTGSPATVPHSCSSVATSSSLLTRVCRYTREPNLFMVAFILSLYKICLRGWERRRKNTGPIGIFGFSAERLLMQRTLIRWNSSYRWPGYQSNDFNWFSVVWISWFLLRSSRYFSFRACVETCLPSIARKSEYFMYVGIFLLSMELRLNCRGSGVSTIARI